MIRLILLRALTLLSVLAPVVSLTAQSDLVNRKLSLWFLEERFLITDQNDDALLDRDEMRQFPREFAYYLDARHFVLSDKNKDGMLSFNELRARTKSENLYRLSQDRRQIRALAYEFPYLDQADPKYLKGHPELVKNLFGNLVWLYDNPSLAAKVYKDKMWTSQHPEVLLALHRNLRWMAANPNNARFLYRDRSATQRLPELLAWRADHKDFMRQYPKVNVFDNLDFIPEAIQINR